MANNSITIQGEIIPFKSWGDGYISLHEVEEQLKNSEGDIDIDINSIGGDVDEGFMIYSAIRRYAKDNNAKVTTYAKGRVSSIATVIFLAGDKRVGNRFVEPFVHNAWTYAVGDANELTRVAADLERVNARIASFYSEHTELTYDEAREMMNNDTFITPEESIAIRFATEIEEVLRPVALQRITNNKNKNKMAKNNNDVLAKLKKFLALEGASNTVELYTNTNETLVFSDLNEGDTPKVGDKATIDGKSADGEYTLADGTVYVFDAGELTEIRDNYDDDDDRVEVLTEEISALKAENAELKASVNKILASQKETEKSFKALKGILSDVVIEDKGNGKKSGDEEEEEKKGLVGAINKRRTKNKK